MASYKINGPLCMEDNPGVCLIDEGTMCRMTTASPVIVGRSGPMMTLRSNVKITVADKTEWEVIVLQASEAKKWMKAHEGLVADRTKTAVPFAKDFITLVLAIYPAIKFEKVITKIYKGEDYIIIKGYAGLRKILTGTRYKAENPKVLKYAIGRVGLREFAKDGFVFSVIIISAVDVAEAFLSDEPTLRHDLGFTLTADISKAFVASLVGYAAMVGVAAVTSVAIAPVAAGILVALAVGIVLDEVFPTADMVTAMRSWCDAMYARAQRALTDAGRAVRHAEDVWDSFYRSLPSLRSLYDNAQWQFLHYLSAE